MKSENLDIEENCSNIEVEEDSNHKLKATPIWLISIAVHALVIGLTILVVFAAKVKPEDDVVISTEIIEEEEEELDEEKEIEIVKEDVVVEVEEDVVLPPVVTEEEVTDHQETESDMEAETAEGAEDAISDMPLAGSGLVGTIGGGGGGGGSFGARTGGGKKRALLRGGGSKKTESAVDWALKWLAEHQEADGHWDSGKYEGEGTPMVDSACTGAALLAFLGAGHTDRVGKYKDHVKRAIKWLLAAQQANGSFDKINYANGICTMAIAEATGMGCGGSSLREATKVSVDYLLQQQNKSGGYNYVGPNERDDISITGWCIMALKSASVSGIREKEIKEAFHKVEVLLDSFKSSSGDNSSTTKGLSWYEKSHNNKADPLIRESVKATTAITMLIRQYLGWRKSEPWLVAASQGQISKIPAGGKWDMPVYRIYYAYLALFQQGGEAWKKWNEPVSKVLVENQRKDGDFRGSWDSNNDAGMDKGGRVLTTAFLCLSLEVYYRYASVTH